MLLALLTIFGGLSLWSFADETEMLTEDTAAFALSKEEAFAQIEKSQIYQTLYKGLQNVQTSIDLQGLNCTVETLQETLQFIRNECPDVFYVESSYSFSSDRETSYVTKLSPRYSLEGNALALARAEYEAFMQELYAMGSESWSDLETVLFYHDYLAAYYEYDTTYTIHDAYSFLKEKKGVCQSYTLVFQGLMNHFEIPCTFASSENINHIWNIVYVDGAWYHLDVTHDDPLYSGSTSYDLEGYIDRTYLLAGSTSSIQNHFTKPSGSYKNDTVYGADINISESDHPYSALWAGTTAPIVEAGGSFYGIIKELSPASAKLVRYNFEKGLYTTLATLSTQWMVADGSGYYPGNYSGLCTDGLYLYYNEDSAIYRYDTEKNIRTQLSDITCPETEKIYGLRMEEEHLVMYTCAKPYQLMTAYTLEKTYPVYYTITWIIDGEESYSYAAEGELPSFDGSTWIQGGNGISYEFVGWTPEIVPVECDATYTACYLIVKDYLPGDISGDGEVDISDVTALLGYLSNPESAAVNMAALDPNGDNAIDISDVTALLGYLSDNSLELN